jgi:L-fucose dehydrogenase
MDLQLKDQVILVSGGAKGIGAAIVSELVAEQAIPVIIGRSATDNENLLKELSLPSDRSLQIAGDLALPETAQIAVQKTLEKFGRIDGLVNNAGVNDGVGLLDGSYERFMQSLHNNLVHYYLLAHYAIRHIIHSQGSIVNIGSKTAETGQGGTSAYAAANGGRNALTREWAVDLLKHKVRVNSVIVSECWTPAYATWIDKQPDASEKLKKILGQIPLENRMTHPSEIAKMVLFLLSPASSHTTGQLIHVDGGYVHLDRALLP